MTVTYQYVPVTIRIPTPDSSISEDLLWAGLWALSSRKRMIQSADDIVASANIDRSSTPAEVRYFAKDGASEGSYRVKSIRGGARIYYIDGYTKKPSGIDVVVKNGKAIRKPPTG